MSAPRLGGWRPDPLRGTAVDAVGAATGRPQDPVADRPLPPPRLIVAGFVRSEPSQRGVDHPVGTGRARAPQVATGRAASSDWPWQVVTGRAVGGDWMAAELRPGRRGRRSARDAAQLAESIAGAWSIDQSLPSRRAMVGMSVTRPAAMSLTRRYSSSCRSLGTARPLTRTNTPVTSRPIRLFWS